MIKRWKFTLLLIVLVVLLVLHPIVDESVPGTLLYEVMLSAVFLSSILVLFQRRQSRVMAIALGLPAVVGVFTHYFLPGLSSVGMSILFHLVPVFFFGYTVLIILRTIFTEAGVSADSINGAFCGYLLLGVAFGHLYSLAESLRPASFNLPADFRNLPESEARRHSALVYFSLITLTTVGYGDITPQGPLARSLACVEAVIGQFYVAVIVAELISLKVSVAIRDQQLDRPAPPA